VCPHLSELWRKTIKGSDKREIQFGEKCAVVGKRMKCGGEPGAHVKKDAHALLHGRLKNTIAINDR
jgi:hypothetical protein